jgi:hypothetical protein
MWFCGARGTKKRMPVRAGKRQRLMEELFHLVE